MYQTGIKSHSVLVRLYIRGCRGQGPPHYWGFSSTDTSQSVELLWMSDQPKAEDYLATHSTYNWQIFIGRWDSNSNSQQASGFRPTS